jgi:hypothetical protein
LGTCIASAFEPPIAAYSFDEGEGEVAHDAAGDHDGAVEGADWVGGKYGGALSFEEEEEDSVDIPASSELDLTDAFTLEAWVRPQTADYGQPVLFKETPTFFSYALYAGGDERALPEGLVASKDWSYAQVQGEEEMPAKAWSHLALASDGEDLRLYLDGELVDTAPAKSAQISEGSLRIGGDPTFEESYFTGLIDEVRIYDRALSAEEIEEDMGTAIEAPTNTALPRVPSTPHETLDLEADAGKWSGNKPLSFEYQWKRCDSSGENCLDIEGATTSVYTPIGTDVGGRLRLSVKATNNAGSAEAVSNASNIVLHSSPVFIDPVSVEGVPKEGEQLSADLGGLRGSPTLSLTYHWRRCDENCNAISSAEASTYTLVSADVATRIELEVVAENEFGTARSVSSVSEPIEPAETEGAPLLADRPRLLGLYRVTDKMGSTTGIWRGAKPLTTVTKWQRCTPDLEECEDIEGATDQLYEPVTEDEGMRLRTVVEAENGSGSEVGESIASPPILPAVNSVFRVKESATLEAVVTAAEEAGSPLLSVNYGTETASLYATRSSNPSKVLSDLTERLGPEAAQLPTQNFVLQGDIASKDLGELDGDVDRSEIPSMHSSNESITFSEKFQFVRHAINSAKLSGFGPVEANTSAEGPFADPPLVDRALFGAMHWNLSSEAMLARMYEVGSPMAFEFDIKLGNEDNTNISVEIEGVPLQGICLPWESNNFWIDDRDSVEVESTFPGNAGLYWDTDASDSCQEKDLTLGLYHPEFLDSEGPEMGSYETRVYFTGEDAAGDAVKSDMIWSAQLLGRHCDTNPLCVNIPDVDIEGEGGPMINQDDEFFYEFPSPDEGWGAGRLPNCFTFLNPVTALPGTSEDLLGPRTCVFQS